MKYTIKHGAEIDIATADEIAQAVAQMRDQREVIDYTRRKDNIQLNGAGAGHATVKVSSQYDWEIERVSIGGAGAVNALVLFYENASSDVQSDLDLLEVVQLGAAGRYSDSFSNNLRIPANSQLYISVTNGVANLLVAYNLQIKEIPRGFVV